MADGRRSGYRTPDDVLADPALSAEAKIDLLEQWKLTLTRPVAGDPLPLERNRRAADIDEAIAALRGGPPPGR